MNHLTRPVCARSTFSAVANQADSAITTAATLGTATAETGRGMGAAAVGGSEPVVTGAATASPHATYLRDRTIDLSIVGADFSTRRTLEALAGIAVGS